LRRRDAFAGRFEPNLADLLDLVALGTVADVVKLEHNNRVLVEQGLMRIRSGRCCKGILALLSVAGRDAQRAGSYDLGFVLGPRINAAGRLDDMSIGIACLLADDMPTAMHLATELDRLNRERRSIEADMREAATQSLETTNTHDRYSICLYQPDWHQGVVGIVAGRIREQTHRPVIAFARDENGKLRGSGRSIPALHLRDALDLVTKRHPDLILRFGGHAMAAGLTIEESSLAAFSMALEQVARELLSPVDLLEIREVDGGLGVDDLDFEFVRSIDAQVWGQGFVAPAYLGRFQVLEQRIVGEKHLKLRLRLGTESYEAIRFGSADGLPTWIEAIYRPTINVFRGTAVVQLNIDHVL
jgi:single-stranded-DNA-specific exonuclease